MGSKKWIKLNQCLTQVLPTVLLIESPFTPYVTMLPVSMRDLKL
ncbi:hypothetical protein VCRA2126O85_20270 [Vibrio crassostreae]|nr:hypothetical protein VCRA2126O86_20270 [Vibrio crassostreae]CAK2849422.1 hypothetical protein VCRA2127O91_20274 [Vibrio crassostreae]CAK2853235.1 hypothetical protein VCRA2126O85_20270 [Vibrio crassostreae]CAK2855674.1 hypothetical protein VCRA2125O83_20276 [Vibrio crassostreae]CAK2907858.1 hypothetical protein VCRA2128O100_30006 [Vibrio crassostreae]